MNRPKPLSEHIRKRMSAQPVQGTQPELALRRLLHQAGFRYRVGYPVPGATRRTIDIAFTKKKIAVFVDGCFWHGCPIHSVPPKNNADWWAAKLGSNGVRDSDTTALLVESGWEVLRLWEHVPPVDMLSAVTALWHHGKDLNDEGFKKC